MSHDDVPVVGSTSLRPVDVRLIDRLHDNFPVTDRPFAQVAQELGLTEQEVIERLRRLLSQGVLTRFGPLFQIEKAGGQFVLAAMEVPESEFERISQQLNQMPEVAHNYRRDHRLNMWFVVAAASRAEAAAALKTIEDQTGLSVYAFPKEREYFVGLKLSAAGAQPSHGTE
jgi:DNA-binding Lrp family transcriptional regulator